MARHDVVSALSLRSIDDLLGRMTDHDLELGLQLLRICLTPHHLESLLVVLLGALEHGLGLDVLGRFRRTSDRQHQELGTVMLGEIERKGVRLVRGFGAVIGEQDLLGHRVAHQGEEERAAEQHARARRAADLMRTRFASATEYTLLSDAIATRWCSHSLLLPTSGQ